MPIARALRLFADSANFPILVHCVIGKDRTGLVIMLLLLLCGVNEQARLWPILPYPMVITRQSYVLFDLAQMEK